VKRDLGALAAEECDLLVIGGGIYGAACAREAALRGLRVALVEREDFAAATSWNSAKTIHGGIRYLQGLDLRRARESIAERRRFLRLAPHLVRPLEFALPTRGRGARSRAALAAALALHGLLGLSRNRGVLPERRLPGGRVVGRAELRRLAPLLEPASATGAAIWWDAQLRSSERAVLSFAQAAAGEGARLANHAEALSLLAAGGRVCGALVRDAISGQAFEVRARHVLNCAGPGAWDLLGRGGALRPPPVPLGRAGNVVLRRELFPGVAVGLEVEGAAEGQGRQTLFAAPWRGRTLLGTLHLPVRGEPRAELAEAEVARLLAAVSRACPAAELSLADVVVVHAGLQAVAGWERASGLPRHAPDPIWIDHEPRDGVPGLTTLVGVKLTEAPGAAARALDRVCARLGAGRPAPPDGGPPLPGGGFASLAGLWADLADRAPAGLARASLEHLGASRGSAAGAVLELAAAPGLAEPVAAGSPVIGAEVVLAVREEMALTLSDVVLRRTELGARGDASPAALSRCGALAARELGWSAERLAAEIAAVRRALALPWEAA
jgi:glycerol-3-phosphate dehydrogenase